MGALGTAFLLLVSHRNHSLFGVEMTRQVQLMADYSPHARYVEITDGMASERSLAAFRADSISLIHAQAQSARLTNSLANEARTLRLSQLDKRELARLADEFAIVVADLRELAE